jgi:hypothetical protein
MTGKCVECNLYWNISIKKNIPEEGYTCPRCVAKKNKSNEKDKLLKHSKKKNDKYLY